MNWRPGRAWFGWLGGAGAMTLASFGWPDAAWGVLPLILIPVALSVVDGWSLRRAHLTVTVRREVPLHVGRGVPFSVTWHLQTTRARTLRCECRETLPGVAEPSLWRDSLPLLPGVETVRSFPVQIPVRGRYPVGPAWVRVGGRFGCLERQWMAADAEAIRVLPEGAVSQDAFLRELAATPEWKEVRLQNRFRGEGREFDALSPFASGDDIRRIDWRSSARHSQLQVRRYQMERHRDVMILLDCGRLMGQDCAAGTKFDQAVHAGLMLARVALERGDRCGMAVFDNAVRAYIPPRMQRPQYHALLECLYDKQSAMRETDFAQMFARLQTQQRKRALVIILSDMTDHATTRRYRQALATLSRRHIVLFAALRTPLLREPLASAPVDAHGIARAAVAMRLLRERDAALHEIRHAGIPVLDTEPDQLTVPLINQYVSLRDGARL